MVVCGVMMWNEDRRGTKYSKCNSNRFQTRPRWTLRHTWTDLVYGTRLERQRGGHRRISRNIVVLQVTDVVGVADDDAVTEAKIVTEIC